MDYQGKRPDQIETAYKGFVISLLGIILLLVIMALIN